MNNSFRTTYFYNNKIMSIPLIGDLFYIIQHYLFETGLNNHIFLSRKKSRIRDKLIRHVSNESASIVCRSIELGKMLEEINTAKIFDVSVKNYGKFNTEQLYFLMWSLVFSDSVTEKTKKSLGNFIPANFPVKKPVVIPYNDSLEVICDFIFQTAKVLSHKGFDVHLVPLANPISIFKLLRQETNKNDQFGFFNKNKINLDFPVIPFPLRLLKFKLIGEIGKKLSRYYAYYLIKLIKPDYLWCFDPADFSFVEKLKGLTTTIYDCVDYFSTLDRKLEADIKSNEEKLIKAADYFFVNSRVLEKVKKVMKKPNSVVEQGFDYESFATNKGISQREKKEIERLKRIIAKIPGPKIGFVGNITYRLNFSLLSSLTLKLPQVSFIFTDAFLSMPHDDRMIGTEKQIAELKKAKNVYFIPKTHSRRVIKEILKKIDIGMIPYNVKFDFNRYSYPMKLFEYFYLGKPVVSTPIEELRRFPDFVKIGNSVTEWERIINELLSRQWPLTNKTEQRRLAKENSWDNKINSILNLI